MPVIYQGGSSGSGSVNIPELTVDPVSPPSQSAWVLRSGGSSLTGTPLGLLLSLTHDITAAFTYQLSYQTIEGPIVRTPLV